MSVYRMEIPGWRPALANELIGKHWAVIHKRKRRDLLRLSAALWEHAVPHAKVRRRVKIEISWPFRRLPDPDAPLKSFLDGLARSGAIVDDSARWCQWEVPVFIRGPKGSVITLEDL